MLTSVQQQSLGNAIDGHDKIIIKKFSWYFQLVNIQGWIVNKTARFQIFSKRNQNAYLNEYSILWSLKI